MIAVMLFQLIGCSNTLWYDVQEDDKGYYIDIKGVNRVRTSDMCINYLTDLEFDSLKELKNTLKPFRFTQKQLETMDMFFRDKEGKVRIPYFDKFYFPVFPAEYEYNKVHLDSTSYSFAFSLDDNVDWVVVEIPDEIGYQNLYDYYYDSFYTDANIIEHNFEETKNADIYYYNNQSDSEEVTFKRVRYTLKNDSKTLIVDETYNLGISNDIPYEIKIFGEQDGVKFFNYLYKLSFQPSEDWLLGIGLEECLD